MPTLFIGKRFYTNRDALKERFGRIYQLPYHWAKSGSATHLWLIDYHTRESGQLSDQALSVFFTSVRNLSTARRILLVCTALFRPHARFDLVVASGDCYVGLLGYLIAKIHRARFAFDVYDKYDEFETYRRLGPFDPFHFLLRRSDSLIFASHALAGRIGGLAGKAMVAPNGIDAEKFRGIDMVEARVRLELPADKTLIGYFGSMEECRGVDDLIAAAGLLRQTQPEVELVIAGRSRLGITLDRDWIHYLGNLPFEHMPAALASCNVLAMPYRRSPFLDMASSCKIIEYIAARRPIVATRTPNLTENFPEQCRQLEDLLAEPGDIPALAESIRKQLSSGRLATMPTEMEWRDIAARTLAFLQKADEDRMRA